MWLKNHLAPMPLLDALYFPHLRLKEAVNSPDTAGVLFLATLRMLAMELLLLFLDLAMNSVPFV